MTSARFLLGVFEPHTGRPLIVRVELLQVVGRIFDEAQVRTGRVRFASAIAFVAPAASFASFASFAPFAPLLPFGVVFLGSKVDLILRAFVRVAFPQVAFSEKSSFVPPPLEVLTINGVTFAIGIGRFIDLFTKVLVADDAVGDANW